MDEYITIPHTIKVCCVNPELRAWLLGRSKSGDCLSIQDDTIRLKHKNIVFHAQIQHITGYNMINSYLTYDVVLADQNPDISRLHEYLNEIKNAAEQSITKKRKYDQTCSFCGWLLGY